MSLLETKVKVRLVQQAEQCGGLFDAVPDLTNGEESIFVDTEGNIGRELILSGTLAKEFAGDEPKPPPKDQWRRIRIQRIVAYWDLPKV